MRLTLDGLIRTLRGRMHELAEEPRRAYDPPVRASQRPQAIPRRTRPDAGKDARHDRSGR